MMLLRDVQGGDLQLVVGLRREAGRPGVFWTEGGRGFDLLPRCQNSERKIRVVRIFLPEVSGTITLAIITT